VYHNVILYNSGSTLHCCGHWMALLAVKSILHNSYLQFGMFRRRKLPLRQSKHMGSCADNSFAVTFYLPDEGRSRTSRRAANVKSVPALKRSTWRRRTTTWCWESKKSWLNLLSGVSVSHRSRREDSPRVEFGSLKTFVEIE